MTKEQEHFQTELRAKKPAGHSHEIEVLSCPSAERLALEADQVTTTSPRVGKFLVRGMRSALAG